MKRDMDLARRLLLYVEELPFPTYGDKYVQLEGYNSEEISYHLLLLTEAGLIETKKLASLGAGKSYFPIRLTWEGHEFLDAARNDNNWNQAKDVAGKAGGWTLEIMKNILTAIATKAALSLVTGQPIT